MKIAVISDVHGNLPALNAVISDLEGVASLVISLGDVVNYGPWSNECVERLTNMPRVICLQGNHEQLFHGLHPLDHEMPLVQSFCRVTMPTFNQAEVTKTWPLHLQRGKWVFTHTIDEKKIYADTEINPKQSTFLGHTHHSFDVQRGMFRIVNPGSVGQNRKRLDIACYAIFDEDSETVELRYVNYDVRPLFEEMRRKKYPNECLAYYESKM